MYQTKLYQNWEGDHGMLSDTYIFQKAGDKMCMVQSHMGDESTGQVDTVVALAPGQKYEPMLSGQQYDAISMNRDAAE